MSNNSKCVVYWSLLFSPTTQSFPYLKNKTKMCFGEILKIWDSVYISYKHKKGHFRHIITLVLPFLVLFFGLNIFSTFVFTINYQLLWLPVNVQLIICGAKIAYKLDSYSIIYIKCCFATKPTRMTKVSNNSKCVVYWSLLFSPIF